RTALLTTWDRAVVFLRKAGTNILAICIVLWWLSSFPVHHSARADDLRGQAAAVGASGVPDAGKLAEGLRAEADRRERSEAVEQSFAGRIGRGIEPVLRPLGYDWQLGIGILTSFAAREVFVSTMSVVLAGEERKDPDAGFFDAMARARRDDGVTPVFTRAACW